MRRLLPALLLLLAASLARAASVEDWVRKARGLRLDRDPAWLRLLHYRRRLTGFRSDEDSPAFFLSPRGKTDPGAELEADLQAFAAPSAPGLEDKHAQCRFPLRYRWLKERLGAGDEDFPSAPCPQLEEWLSRIAPDSVSLIFASAYLHNPASMYGHTFLRLNEGTNDLTSYCVNFAADTKETSGIFFAFKGLAGFYPGTFSTVPFYFKVQQYNNIESRDLWEYRLNLDAAAIQRLRLHLWELGPAVFDYHFFTENCAYELLPLLEVADPGLSVSERFWLKAIPIDTLRALALEPGMVTERKFRPSAVSEMLALRSQLSPGEVRAAEDIARKTGPGRFGSLDRLPPGRQGPALQAGYLYFRYRHGFPRFADAAYDASEREILLRLNRTAVQEISVPEPEPPESGHPSGRVGLTTGFLDKKPFQEIAIRPALHDLLDPPGGYTLLSRLEMIHLRLRYHPLQDRISLRRFTVADVFSLSPLDPWIRKPSWRLFIGADTAQDRARSPGDGLIGRVTTGSGFSLIRRTGRLPAAVYGMGQLEVAAGDLERKYRAGPGALAGVWLQPAEWWRISAEGEYFYYALGDLDGLMKSRVISAFQLGRAQFRAAFERAGSVDEASFTLYWFL